MKFENETKELFYMQQVYATLFSASNKLQTAGDKAFGNLSSKQYMTILGILHLPENKTNLNNIAKKLGTTKQNARQLISALEKKGYVNVMPNESDKRAVNIRVTDSGLTEMVCCSEAGILFLADAFKEFTIDDLQTFWELLKKLHRFDGEKQDGFEADPTVDFKVPDEKKQNVLQQFAKKRFINSK